MQTCTGGSNPSPLDMNDDDDTRTSFTTHCTLPHSPLVPLLALFMFEKSQEHCQVKRVLIHARLAASYSSLLPLGPSPSPNTFHCAASVVKSGAVQLPAAAVLPSPAAACGGEARKQGPTGRKRAMHTTGTCPFCYVCA